MEKKPSLDSKIAYIEKYRKKDKSRLQNFTEKVVHPVDGQMDLTGQQIPRPKGGIER